MSKEDKGKSATERLLGILDLAVTIRQVELAVLQQKRAQLQAELLKQQLKGTTEQQTTTKKK